MTFAYPPDPLLPESQTQAWKRLLATSEGTGESNQSSPPDGGELESGDHERDLGKGAK